MYSALKVNGEKLVDLARRGIEIEREARKITVYSLEPEVINEAEGLYRISVACSKGTYIRTLCADIGAKLGCGGTMKTLARLEAGGFTIDDAITLEELENLEPEEREKREVDLLIARIAKIKETIPAHHVPSDEEEAFDEAAEETEFFRPPQHYGRGAHFFRRFR